MENSSDPFLFPMLTDVHNACSRRLSLCILMLLSLSASRAFPDIWSSPESSDTYSGNGAYMFRVTPTSGHGDMLRRGTCRGVLYAKHLKELSLRWERSLVNDICPIKAVVADSGRYVVTIGEWYGYDRLPIVVYGPKGDLINVYGELRQIIDTRRFLTDRDGATDGTGIPHSEGGWHWLSHSLMFFSLNDEYFIVRLRNKGILVFETDTGRLIDDKWRERNADVSPEKIKKYDDLTANLGRLIVLKSLALAASELAEERDEGKFVLKQCRDRDSISVVELALKDPTSRTVKTPRGSIREYPIRKAASEALRVIGKKVPEGVVTEEAMETKKR
jgi:hypothetical protein